MPRPTRTPASPPARTDPAAAPAPSQPPAPPAEALPEPDFGYAPPAHYDPADYRWVPVKRVPRTDGWTEEKQRRFIEVLADTGLVGRAAKAVGMSREAAYKLRRAPHAAAFARAWDLARERAGALIEDVAFERAIEGVETEIYNAQGALTGSKTIYNDRLLTFLLRRLKPERYGTVDERRAARFGPGAHGGDDPVEPVAHVSGPAAPAPPSAPPEPLPATLDAALRAMEPQLPAPAETLLDPETLEDELLLAEVADGTLPRFLSEQAPVPTREEERAAHIARLYERGRVLYEEEKVDWPDNPQDDAAFCLYLDPSQARELPRKWRTPRTDRDG